MYDEGDEVQTDIHFEDGMKTPSVGCTETEENALSRNAELPSSPLDLDKKLDTSINIDENEVFSHFTPILFIWSI